MAISIMKAVWDARLPDSISKTKRSIVKSVLIKLSDNANSNGVCYPSMARIAHETEMSERSVIRAIQDLKDANLVMVETKRKNGVKHNTYYINIPLIESLKCEYKSKRGDDELQNPFITPSDNWSKPSDNWSQKDDQMAVEPSLTTKEPSGTDIFHPEKRIPLEDILHEHGLTYCKSAIEELELINEQRYTVQAYTGSLTLDEWLSCEEAMRSVDEFDMEYFTWWMETRSKAMRKSPSLPNMLCDMRGSTFAEFYDSTFMQEWD